MVIKILGKGCAKCKHLEELTHQVLADLGMDVEIVKVTDMDEIMEYDILSTPGLVIDENVVSSGRVPRREEIREWLQTLSMQ